MSAPSSVATAAANCDIMVLKELISQGEDVNQISADGMTPLGIAAFWGYAEVVKILLENGADINQPNRGTLWTPLHCASFQGHGKVIMKLIDFNPNLQAQDNQGRTPIDFASALDSIWPFFADVGCPRTSKSELLRMNIIKKVVHEDPAVLTSDHIRFSSRPGSAYIMNKPYPRETQYSDSKMAYASMNGDVLAATPDTPNFQQNQRTSTLMWQNR